MDTGILPRSITIEYGCKMNITSERSSYNDLSQADHKLEISFEKGDKLYHFETNFTNLIKILENADESLSQSNKLMSYKD